MPRDGLIGIAVEGLAPEDQKSADSRTIEVADLVLYFGKIATFEKAKAVAILQFKYSIGSKTVPFRAADAKKTLHKFAAAYRSHKRQFGALSTRKKLRFELITNRPVLNDFNLAIESIASGTPVNGNQKRQAAQFKRAAGLKAVDLREFAKMLRVTGLAGSLKEIKQDLSRVVADWSVARDAMAQAMLGNIRQLLRDKAGSEGEGRNVIRRVDVLHKLNVQSPADLLPCPAVFPEIGRVVAREQLPTVLDLIPKLDKPLLIHAEGGLGKTVFMQSLAKALADSHKVILFDCFGGGAYRAPEDARHLPKRGLIHIVNSLAVDGLCDPLLPSSENVEDLIRAFRSRLAQTVATLKRVSHNRQLLLFIDAIDNAAEHARDKGESAFPTLILESFHHIGSEDGVQLILSSRSERQHHFSHIDYLPFSLQPFTKNETEQYVRERLPKATETEVRVAYARSTGNPRILEHLVNDRQLLDHSELTNKIQLDDLLRGRIANALRAAERQGYHNSAINAFLAGLSVLPPPVPIADYADAHGMDLSAIRSFAADLAPLLEQTKHGLIFRDEPTETLLRNTYGSEMETLRTLADNLLRKQEASVYAASALPGLLQKLDDGKRLFELAFDSRFPSKITSAVGRQKIRYMRLKASVLHAARNSDFDQLVHLLLELSTQSAVNERGSNYLLNNPDLVIASEDVDAIRRLYEIRTTWAGTRFARLAIASVLAADLDDASRHAVSANEWISHFYNQKDNERNTGPETLDVAAIPLYLIARNSSDNAAGFIKSYIDWYAFEICERVFALLEHALDRKSIEQVQVEQFLRSLTSHVGALTGAISFSVADSRTRRRLISELAKACTNVKEALKFKNNFNRDGELTLEDGLQKSATIALSLNMYAEAKIITSIIPHERPSIWAYDGPISNHYVLPFITHSALVSAADKTEFNERDIIPSELFELCHVIKKDLTGDDFRNALKATLSELSEKEKGVPESKRTLSYERMRTIERFLDERLKPLMQLALPFASLLGAEDGSSDEPFLELLDSWNELRSKRSGYSNVDAAQFFFHHLGLELLVFALWSRSDLGETVIETFVHRVSAEGVSNARTLAEITKILSKRSVLHSLAGTTAVTCRTLVEREDDVLLRANLFARLSRAIFLASREEAVVYFRLGLEQMDAIGSGDYQFTNELLLFATELKGNNLEERDFHILGNICELNMHSEEEKFPWLAFGRALSRTSGNRMLARLGRWHDRSKVSIDYTLLPYLMAMLEQDKIDPGAALSLLRLADPAELWNSGTKELVELVERKSFPNAKQLIAELIQQFERNHPGAFMPATLEVLRDVSTRVLGGDAEETTYLRIAAARFRKVRDEQDPRKYPGMASSFPSSPSKRTQDKDLAKMRQIAAETDTSSEESMSRAIELLETLGNAFAMTAPLFQMLRKKVAYSDRGKYIQIVSRLAGLKVQAKFEELKACKNEWSSSSVALASVFSALAVPLIKRHSDDFVLNAYFSGWRLKELSDLSRIPSSLLAMELIQVFASCDSDIPSSIWLGIATFICEKANPGVGQAALKRLLNSDAARLADSITDGAWNEKLYPSGAETDTAAGLIWLMLGSPLAEERWRAAHSVRCLARFGKWDVIDILTEKLGTMDAGPFQAPELVFYFLYARLWLLIALARIAKDHPNHIANYSVALKGIALNTKLPHVLIRHFAALALITCAEKGALALSNDDKIALNSVNVSQFPPQAGSSQNRDSFYSSRPNTHPKPADEFHLDYDFDKMEIDRVARIFDISRWEVKDALTAWVRKFDSKVSGMYERGGRYASHRETMRGLSDENHGYGQQLGWNALFLVAGELLMKYPVATRTNEDNDVWRDWLNGEVLSRRDGFWLADGVDKTPVSSQVNLLEKGKKGLVLTSHSAKILAVLGIKSSIAAANAVTVAGYWPAADDVDISVNSAFVKSQEAESLAKRLASEDGFNVWLPQAEAHEDDNESDFDKKPNFLPWIVRSYHEGRLDKTDPLAADSVLKRLHFFQNVASICNLHPIDEFRRAWVDNNGTISARSQAWGRNTRSEDKARDSGYRLTSTPTFLKTILSTLGKELLILVILRHNEKGVGSQESKYWYTTGVLHIKQSLDFVFHLGNENRLFVPKW